jgi:LPS export ABC transporter protein LptC
MTKSLLIVIGFFLTAACGVNDADKVKVMTDRRNMPLETGKNMVINYTDSGYVKAKIFAPMMERYANEERNETVMKQGMTAYFLNKNKKVESYLKSKYAIRLDRERKMVARDDVILVNNKGDTLRTELLTWDETTQKIYTDKFIRITTPDQIILGDGLESNTEFTEYKIFKIRGTINLKKP